MLYEVITISIATFMEHLGDITTNGSVVKQDFFEDPGLHRTLIGDGLATMLAGFIGGPANTTYGENTGVLAVTKNYDPRTLRVAATYAIILSIFGFFGAFRITSYNVCYTKLLRNGQHQGLNAGMDLTEEFNNSPHLASMLNDMTVVGELETEAQYRNNFV